MSVPVWVSGLARIALWFLFYCFSILMHELGHLAGAVMVGFKPMQISVGFGNRRTLFRTGDLQWKLGTNPLGGMMMAAAINRERYRLRYLFYVACGPAATVLVLVLAINLNSAAINGQLPPWWIDTTPGFIIGELILLFYCLWPMNVRMEGRSLRSDGKSLLRALMWKEKETTGEYVARANTLSLFLLQRDKVDESREVMRRAAKASSPHDLEIMTFWIHLLLANGKGSRAREEIESMLGGVDGFSRVDVLDALACMPLYWDDLELLPEAEKWIDEAIEIDPEKLTLLGTKGSILVEQGNLEEGETLLGKVHRETASENDRAICDYYLALCCHLKGDTDGAKKHMEAGQKVPTHQFVRLRIQARIAGKKYQNAWNVVDMVSAGIFSRKSNM